jgi:shikimate kinase
MSVYLINGPSGSGKTSIGVELQARGFTVIDTDEQFGFYANLETEQPVEFQGSNVTEEWYRQSGWIWNRKKVEEAIENATETTFFCGGSRNESTFYPKFARIICLDVSPEVLVNRLKDRQSDNHTNNPIFIARMLKFLEIAKADGKSLGVLLLILHIKQLNFLLMKYFPG